MNTQVVLFGDVNAGKSSLFNALIGQPRAIVSDRPGTTTDPVSKAMELLPYGPVTLVDTAGLGDTGTLGGLREKKTRRWLDMADMALYVIDPAHFDPGRFDVMIAAFDERTLPYIVVLMKSDRYRTERAAKGATKGVAGAAGAEGTTKGAAGAAVYAAVRAYVTKKTCINDATGATGATGATDETGAIGATGATGATNAAVLDVSIYDDSVTRLRDALAEALTARVQKERPLAADLLPPGSVAVLVVPIDDAAPIGRLILPQVQFIRSCLDYGIRCHVATDKDFADVFEDLSRVDMVVTDSQAFAAVNAHTPPDIPLTSFSILVARQKGDFAALYAGAQHIRNLKPGDRVLIAEACTHNAVHEDIGRVKLPRVLEKAAGGALTFTFSAGKEFPVDPGELEGYALVVHCGGCMLTPRAFSARQKAANRQGVPFTNFGMALAEGIGILERAVRPFKPLM